jgi:hypothetical protein
MLTQPQRDAYDRDGYVVLPGLVPKPACERMCDRVWDALEAVHGIRRAEPDTWTHPMPRGLQDLCKSDGLAEIASPDFLGAIDDLLGAGTWDPPAHWGGPLANFPSRSPWNVPFRMWHLDYPVRGKYGPRFATKALCVLAPIEPRGGGTLLIAGSHRLCQALAEAAPDGEPGHSTDVRKRLAAEHGWFGDLVSAGDPAERIQRFLVDGTEIDGTPLRVVEFTGAPGDVVFFHPWLFHNSSPNCSDSPRMLVGQNLTTRQGLSIYAKGGSDG